MPLARLPWIMALALLAAAAADCSPDGTTPTCPDLTLFDSRDGGIPPELQQQYQAAIDKGCVTGVGDATSINKGSDGGSTPSDAGGD